MNRKVALQTLLLLTLAALLAGCGKPGAGARLDGTSWVLTSLNGSRPMEGIQVTLVFEDGEISGSAGCNSYFGAYTIEGADGLAFSGIGSTLMACLEPEGIMDQEQAYFTALGSVAYYFKLGSMLMMLDAEATPLLVFGARN